MRTRVTDESQIRANIRDAREKPEFSEVLRHNITFQLFPGQT